MLSVDPIILVACTDSKFFLWYELLVRHLIRRLQNFSYSSQEVFKFDQNEKSSVRFTIN